MGCRKFLSNPGLFGFEVPGSLGPQADALGIKLPGSLDLQFLSDTFKPGFLAPKLQFGATCQCQSITLRPETPRPSR